MEQLLRNQGLGRLALPSGTAAALLTSQGLFSAGSFLLTLAFARLADPQAFASMSYLQLAAALPTAATVSAVTLIGLRDSGRGISTPRLQLELLGLSGSAAVLSVLLFSLGSRTSLAAIPVSFGVLMLYMLYVTSRRAEALAAQPARLVALDATRFVFIILICTQAPRFGRPGFGLFLTAFALAHAPVLGTFLSRSRRIVDAESTHTSWTRNIEVLWGARGLLFGLLLNSVFGQIANLAAPRLCSPAAFAALRGVEVLFLPVFTLLQAGDMAAPGWLRARTTPITRVRFLLILTVILALAPILIGAVVLGVRTTAPGRLILNPIYTRDTFLVVGLSAVYVTIAVNGALQWALLAEERARGFVGVSVASALIGLIVLIVLRREGVLAIVAARLAYECVLGVAIIVILRHSLRSPVAEPFGRG